MRRKGMTEFEAFAHARAPHLLRSAWLLCGNVHEAEDLVQETLAKVYVRWHRRLGGQIDNPAAYAQTALVRTFLSARRRRSSGELPYADPPDEVHPDRAADTDLQLLVAEALAGLARRPRRAGAALPRGPQRRRRGPLLGVSEGAVRNRSMRALDRLRPLLSPSVTTRGNP